MTEVVLYSRGVKLTLDCNSSNRIIEPSSWAGYVSGCDQTFIDYYTWNRGMPRIHIDGTLYKISDMDPVYDIGVIEEQIPRLRNLKRLLLDEPECKIPGYDYSALDEVCFYNERKCIGSDLYRCNEDNEWELIEENSSECIDGTDNNDKNAISILVPLIVLAIVSVWAINMIKKRGVM